MSAAIGAEFHALNQDIVAVKPVESGSVLPQTEDGALLARATGQKSPRSALIRLQTLAHLPRLTRRASHLLVNVLREVKDIVAKRLCFG